MTVDIRPAESSDIDALIELLRQLFDLEHDFTFNADTHQRGLLAMFSRPDEAWVWVAVMDKEVVGMCAGQRLISTATGGPALQIEDMVIDKAYRGQGIGTALFSHIERWASAYGFVRLQLNADRDNTPALSFYDTLDWEQSNLIWLRKHIV